MIRLAWQGLCFVPELPQAHDECVGPAGVGYWRRTSRDDLEIHAVMHFDLLIALPLEADLVVAFNFHEIVRRRVLLAEFPDDLIRRQFPFRGFVFLAVYREMDFAMAVLG